jgi:hypothetical protein
MRKRAIFIRRCRLKQVLYEQYVPKLGTVFLENLIVTQLVKKRHVGVLR